MSASVLFTDSTLFGVDASAVRARVLNGCFRRCFRRCFRTCFSCAVSLLRSR